MAEANGGTHMPLEDMSIMRAIPKMVCFEPTDATMLEKALPQIIDYPGAVYIRMFRKKAEKFTTKLSTSNSEKQSNSATAKT